MEMTLKETGEKPASAGLDFQLHGWLDQYERPWIEFSRGDAQQLHKLADIIQSPKNVFTALTNIGIAIVTQATKRAVEQEIEQIRTWAPTYIAETTGWHKGHYVFGDGTSVGPSGELPFKVAVEHSEKWQFAGSLKEWRLNVAEIASGPVTAGVRSVPRLCSPSS